MVRSVVLARVHDGLPLAANMDDENVTIRTDGMASFYHLFIYSSRLKENSLIIKTKLI